MRRAYFFSGGVLLALGVACGVEVGVEGKACPCDTGAGYVCDTVKNICVHPNQVTTVVVVDGGVVTKPACDPCPCTTDAECTDSTRPVCGPDKVCVQCTPANDKCGPGTYCNTKNQCTIGCRTDDECAKLTAANPFCQKDRHVCVACTQPSQCGGTGKTCTPSGTCATSCSNKDQCGGLECCGGLCIDVTTDVLNCGTCKNACTVDNGTPSCKGSSCTADCADGFGTCPGSGTCGTVLRTDPKNCGKCGNVCANLQHTVTTACSQSKCQVLKCEDGWLNSDNDPANGCEAPCGDVSGSICCPGDVCFGTNLECNNGNHRCKSKGGPG